MIDVGPIRGMAERAADNIERVIVGAAPDAADDWIAERAVRGDIVVTADIPLAARSVKAGADVIGPTGRAFTEASIGNTLATRNLMDELRSSGLITGDEVIRYSASLQGDDLLDAIDTASTSLVTDSNRLRAHHWRSSQDVTGYTETGDEELYDRQKDPDELASVAGDPAYASVKAGLKADLAKLDSCRGTGCRVKP